MWAISFVVIGTSALAAPANATPAYERDYFGTGWADLDHDGCNTRSEILQRDMPDEVLNRCTVKSGSLIDIYQGTRLVIPGNKIEIDHVVALADAWRSGAFKWTLAERIQFSNDMNNLVPTSVKNNRTKSDKSPDQWHPAVDVCRYVLQYYNIKTTYKLSITNAQQQEVDRCK